MIVFDLKCSVAGHVFEAWFASSGAYLEQKAAGQVQCPFCGDSAVDKAVMAPRVGAKGNQRDAVPVLPIAKAADPSADEVKSFLATMAKAQTEMLKTSQWVGREFDEKARAMDAGEIDKGTIHGEVSSKEAKALIEDGIGVMPLPFPFIPPAKRN